MKNKSIIKQTAKSSGRTYVYETEYKYDPKKKKSVYFNRRLIGHIDPDTGEIVKNRKTKPYSNSPGTKREYYGATYLYDQIAEKLGIKEDLKCVIPKYADEILNLAYYELSERNSPVYLYDKWAKTHWTPTRRKISSQHGSDIMEAIDYATTTQFCNCQAKRQSEKDFWFYDITSISSYSKLLTDVKYGHNKENKKLPQINLALLTNQKTGLPFYFRHLAGNISDVATLRKLVKDISDMDIKKIKIGCDRGAWSNKNLMDLFDGHIKFLIGAKMSVNFVKEVIENNLDKLKNYEYYNSDFDMYGMAVPHQWEYEKINPKTKNVQKGTKRSYFHIFYSPQKAIEEGKELGKLLATLDNELKTNNKTEKNMKLYDYYFIKRRKQYIPNIKNIEQERKLHGVFALFTNCVNLNSMVALQIYRDKDQIEKHFTDIKSNLDFRTTKVSSDLILQGKLLIMFIALIIISWIKRKIRDNDRIKVKSTWELLKDLENVELYSKKNIKCAVFGMTKKQKDYYLNLGIAPPMDKS